MPLLVTKHPALPLNGPAMHYLYIKPHVRSSKSTASEATSHTENALYLSNIPFDTTISHLRGLFASEALGNVRIISVDFEDSQPKKKGRDPVALLRKPGSKKRKRGSAGNEESEEAEISSRKRVPKTRAYYRLGRRLLCTLQNLREVKQMARKRRTHHQLLVPHAILLITSCDSHLKSSYCRKQTTIFPLLLLSKQPRMPSA